MVFLGKWNEGFLILYILTILGGMVLVLVMGSYTKTANAAASV